MAICKMCHKSIPEGMDFCEECENKRTNQADESYLDSLLSSVTEDHSEKAADYYSLHSFGAEVQKPEIPAAKEAVADVPASVADITEEIPDIPDEVADISGDLIEETADIETADNEEAVLDITEEEPIDVSEDIISDTEEIIDSVDEETVEEPIEESIEEPAEETIEETVEEPILEAVEEPAEEEAAISAGDIADIAEDIIEDASEEITEDDSQDVPEDVSEEITDERPEDIIDEASEDIPDVTDSSEAIPDIDETSVDISDETVGEDAEVTTDEDVDDLLDGLLADLDAAGGPETEEETDPIGEDDLSEIFAAAEQDHAEEEEAADITDDVFNISEDAGGSDDAVPAEGGQASPEDSPVEDLMGDMPDIEAPVEDLLGDTPEVEPIEDILGDNADAPVEDLMPDGLDAISLDEPSAAGGADSALTDVELTEPDMSAAQDAAPVEDLLGTSEFLSEADLENSDGIKAVSEDEAAFDLDSLLDNLDSGELDKQVESLDGDAKEKGKKKKKEKSEKSLFQRLFGNIVEELTPEQIEAEKAKAEEAEKKKLEAAENKKKQKELSKEEKEAKKAEDKAAKEEAAKKKAEEKKRKAEEAKAKAQKKKEEKLALEALEVNEGRINRVGASILFVIFAIIAIFIILGTNIHYYNVSIKNAQTEFDRKHYNEAYYQVYGLKIKDDDIELFDKIMTVMYVQAEQNAYNNFMKVNNRERALDSLLKGLYRYDKYLELATLLDIEDDLNYVKSMILDELDKEFGLSEAEAYDMMKYVDNIDYSAFIYTILGKYEVDTGE